MTAMTAVAADPDRADALRGKTALVTGASSGIGAALAAALAGSGARLLLTARDTGRIMLQGAEGFPADLGDDEQVRALAARAGEIFPAGLDLLVHAAGVLHWGPLETTPVEELDRQLRINVRAPFLLTQLLLPQLRGVRDGGGRIVFLNSRVAHHPAAGMTSYGASKGALLSLADSLREELAGTGVRVLSVFPGRTATPMQRTLRRLEGQPYEPDGLLQPEDVAAAVLDALTLPPRADMTDLVLRPRP
jgi:NAD(P)-dependent dehydrogenase (short-subunit alcohol dehydrogenase family)